MDVILLSLIITIVYCEQVQPVKDFPQPEINKVSQDLIAQYNRERKQRDTESERQLGQVSSCEGTENKIEL